jgi:HlyD family secretion protein
MNRKKQWITILLMAAVTLLAAGCSTLQEAGLVQAPSNGLQASGTIEASSVLVSSEQGGAILEVYVSEGDQVEAGDQLFRLQDDVLAAQKTQAEAGMAAARSGLQFAQTGVDSAEVALQIAQLQKEIALETARQQVRGTEEKSWESDQPDAFDLPVWYFMQDETIAAAQKEVENARQELADEEENLTQLQGSVVFDELQAAEERLADAQASYLVAQLVQDRADAQRDTDLRDFADQNFNSAQAELDAAQTAYDQLLTDADSQDVLEARARVAVARERYETAQDTYQALLTGENSQSVELAGLGVEQAQAALTQAQAQVDQAETAVSQAQAQLDLINVYMDQLTVHAPVAGVVRTRSVEPGEVLQPGVTALVIDQLEHLTLTVYFPEDQYGQIALGDTAKITADSFPGQTFEGTVIRIADRAEYTPRNVQTQQERVTTVYAVEISLQNSEGKLKPGMPADAVFDN